MNKRPSQTVDALIHTITTETLTQDDILAHLSIMQDNFQKDEAEAYRSLQAVINYYPGIGKEATEKDLKAAKDIKVFYGPKARYPYLY